MIVPAQNTRQTPISINEFLTQKTEPPVRELHWSLKPGIIVNKWTGERSMDMALDMFPLMKQEEWNQMLLTVITDAANSIHRMNLIIHRKNLMGGANLVIVHEDMLKVIETLIVYKADESRTSVSEFEPSVQKVGELANKYTILVSNDLPRYRILVGMLGNGFINKVVTLPDEEIPEIDVVAATDPRFFKGEMSYWTFVNVQDVETP